MKKLTDYLALFILTLGFSTITESKPKLSDNTFNTFSQYGEDGIVQKIFEIIGTKSKICLEVGAGDSPVGSNITNLWKNFGWTAILIEGDPERLKTLEPGIQGYKCLLVKSYIEKDLSLGKTIDSILNELSITDLDLLSLDLDGNDYHVFESLKIHPRVMIIEFNQTIPYYRDIYQDYTDHSWDIGCSVASLIRLGKQKGYEMVALTDNNAFLVDSSYFELFKDYETSVEKLFNTNYLKNIIHSYSGDPLVVAKKNYLCDGFFKVGYQKKMNCHNCYYLRINEIDLNDHDLNINFPGFPKNKPQS